LNSNIKLGAGITAAGSIRDIFAGRKSEILLEQLAMKIPPTLETTKDLRY
jgi:hypothetical protein